jgi:hypothetical protein
MNPERRAPECICPCPNPAAPAIAPSCAVHGQAWTSYNQVWNAAHDAEADLRVLIHAQLGDARGMCSDEMPYPVLDEALAAVDDEVYEAARRLREALDG